MSSAYSKTCTYSIQAPSGWWWLSTHPAHVTLIRGRPPLIDGEYPINMAGMKPTTPFIEAECLKQSNSTRGTWIIRRGLRKKGRIVADDEDNEYVGKTVKEMMTIMVGFATPGCDLCENASADHVTAEGLEVCDQCFGGKKPQKVRKNIT